MLAGGGGGGVGHWQAQLGSGRDGGGVWRPHPADMEMVWDSGLLLQGTGMNGGGSVE